MKTVVTSFLLLLVIVAAKAQNGEANPSGPNKGIEFAKGLSWQQVLQKAKTENKYIFADVYATWCGPCKRMDAEVYPAERAGLAANGKFISLKIQVDKTPADSAYIKAWYHDADSLSNVFGIKLLPTLLFLSPDGKLVTHTEGFKEVDSLITLFSTVTTMKPETWEAGGKFRKEQHFYGGIKNLALEAKELGHGKIADSIASLYIGGYLLTLEDSDLFTKENITFITGFSGLIKPGDRVFNFIYSNPKAFNEATREGYADALIKYVITRDEVDPRLFAEGKPITDRPDWENLRNTLSKKYNDELANALTSTGAQIAFYRKIKDWRQYAAMIDAAIKKYPPQINGHVFANETMTGAFFQRDDWNLNSSAWDVFLHCSDKEMLKTAVEWSDVSIRVAGDERGMDASDQYYDTKANLLYKLGKAKEAIGIEEKAYHIVAEKAKKDGKKGGGEGYLKTINQMKAGEPTWPVAK